MGSFEEIPFSDKLKNTMKAMILAAGLGTRLGNETADRPKALVEVGGKTLLQHAIEKVKSCGVSEVVINVHHFAGSIIGFIEKNDFGVKIHISDETGSLLETGGGIKKAARWLTGSEPVLIYNVDILSSIDLDFVKKQHLDSGALATLVVRNRETQRYFLFDRQKQLAGWINKKTGEKRISREENIDFAVEMAFSGIHFIRPELFSLFPRADRFSITDFYLEMAKTHSIKGFFDDSETWMDVGKPEQLEEARRIFTR